MNQRLLLAVVGGLLAVFLLLPVLLVVATPDWLDGMSHPTILPALRLSLWTSSVALVLVLLLGTPLAWLLATSTSRGARVLEAAVQLPMVLPPAVAGVALLLAFGRRGVLAGWLFPESWTPAFSTVAVILAQVFVAAPLYIQGASSAFRQVPAEVLALSRVFGASPLALLLQVAVPIARPALLAAAALAWARALGEFGATLMFAGNLVGETQTLPLAIYTALESDWQAARALAVVLIGVALLLLLAVKALTPRSTTSHRSARP